MEKVAFLMLIAQWPVRGVLVGLTLLAWRKYTNKKTAVWPAAFTMLMVSACFAFPFSGDLLGPALMSLPIFVPLWCVGLLLFFLASLLFRSKLPKLGYAFVALVFGAVLATDHFFYSRILFFWSWR